MCLAQYPSWLEAFWLEEIFFHLAAKALMGLSCLLSSGTKQEESEAKTKKSREVISDFSNSW